MTTYHVNDLARRANRSRAWVYVELDRRPGFPQPVRSHVTLTADQLTALLSVAACGCGQDWAAHSPREAAEQLGLPVTTVAGRARDRRLGTMLWRARHFTAADVEALRGERQVIAPRVVVVPPPTPLVCRRPADLEPLPAPKCAHEQQVRSWCVACGRVLR